MKKILGVLISMLLLAAVSCRGTCPVFIQSAYTEADLEFDDRLLGEWLVLDEGEGKGAEVKDEVESEATAETDADQNRAQLPSADHEFRDMLKISSTVENLYRFTLVEKSGVAHFDGHMFRLGPNTYIDLTDAAGDGGTLSIRGHVLMVVREIEPRLVISLMDFEWLESYVNDNPEALAHVTTENGIVITADTDEIQLFLLNHHDELFGSTEALRCERPWPEPPAQIEN
ncbi:MAG TPA: hypothetical protein VIL97_10950 [Thermoanaerobaculia bacterium]